jgi:membrane-associated phospholipid phosphatase
VTPERKLYKRLLALITLFSIELVLTWTIFIIAFIIFVEVWKKFILLKQNTFDYTVFLFLEHFTSPRITLIFRIITFLGSFYFLLGACSFLFIYFMFVRRHHWYSLKIPVVAAGSITVNIILKEIFTRPRPLFPLDSARGFSFPSGHAMVAYSFYGLLIFVAWREITNKTLRNGICMVLLILIHLIGLSRIYLRVHYASDVMAGFALGVIWLIISIMSLRQLEQFSKNRFNKVIKHSTRI